MGEYLYPARWEDIDYLEEQLSFEDVLMECGTCHGEREILTCIDDMCRGLGYCIHGDGYSPCPDCQTE